MTPTAGNQGQQVGDVFCPYHSDFARTHFARGVASGQAKAKAHWEARGLAKAVLIVFEVRGLQATASRREKVLSCTDIEQLKDWLQKALTVKTAAEVFAPPKRPAKVRR
jgi:hypothetical protein